MAEAIPALEIRNLHKRYGDLEVLKGISLTARDGDVISILGSSGSGKSTFLRCINVLETINGGDLLVDDRRTEVTGGSPSDDPVDDVLVGTNPSHPQSTPHRLAQRSDRHHRHRGPHRQVVGGLTTPTRRVAAACIPEARG